MGGRRRQARRGRRQRAKGSYPVGRRKRYYPSRTRSGSVTSFLSTKFPTRLDYLLVTCRQEGQAQRQTPFHKSLWSATGRGASPTLRDVLGEAWRWVWRQSDFTLPALGLAALELLPARS